MNSYSYPSKTPQHRHLRRRDSRVYEKEDRHLLWSPWSGWRVVLKLLYAVIVPAIIIYLLDRFDRVQSQDRAATSPAWTTRPKAGGHAGGSSRDPFKTLWRALPMERAFPHHHERQRQQTFRSAMVQQTAYDSFLLLGDSITQVGRVVPMQSGSKLVLYDCMFFLACLT